ncbi:hypothetical protein QVD17_00817 [Tagetes erecta]|uniref:DUF6821 domain-containing protein n=1 Tax=Tagetes erecta TaxID=13708 RepID=A0AAD8L5U4_TARER|nr:hypothetical protein QVD17_00817 [Tagetes erecta]
MDLDDEEWVSVPCDGILEVHDDGNEKIFSRKYVKSSLIFYEPNHFDTSHTSQEDERESEKQFDHKEEVKEIIKHPILITEPKDTFFGPESNQDPIFHVFLKKENQFVEMKMDFTTLSSQESNLSPAETDTCQNEEKNDDHVVNYSSSSKMIKKEVVAWKESNQRLDLFKWGLNGIGVFCSLGMAAATICIIICGNGTRHKQQNQKLKFQIYTDNKRMKQVVQKANEAMSAVRGVPLANAKITYGGHYESH